MNKTLTKVLSLVGGVAILGGGVLGGMQLWAPENLKPSNWGHVNELPDTGDNGDNDDTVGAGDSFVSVTENHGIMLMSEAIAVDDFEEYGVSAQANSAYTVTATVEPEDSYDKTVIWGLSFANPSSSWANGKNIADYVTISATESDNQTATLTIIQPFGEQVIVKAASRTDSTVFGTSTVDYLKSLDSCTVTLNQGSALNQFYLGNTQNRLTVTPAYGVGTITGTVSKVTTTIWLEESYIDSSDKQNLRTTLRNAGISYSSTAWELLFDGMSFNIPFTSFLEGFDSSQTERINVTLNNFFYNNLPHCNDWVTNVFYNVTYTHNDYKKTLKVTGNTSQFTYSGLSVISTASGVTVGPGIVAYP